MKTRNLPIACILIMMTALVARAGVTPLGTAFTYQGLFKDGGSPATGTYHLRFQLWNALVGGSQVGTDSDFPTLSISDGLFTVPLDFGSNVFDGSARWLQVQVVTNGGATVTSLTPRQPITAAPYALQTRGLFVNDLGFVGIGTTNPGDKLHVVGGVRVESDFSGVWGTCTQPSGWGLRGEALGPDGGIGVRGSAGPTGYAGYFSGRVYVEDNVGIGTFEPVTPLHVRSAVPVMVLQDTAAPENQTGYIDFRNNSFVETAWMGFGSAGSPDFSIVNARSGGDIILSPFSGNVGIGTTSPSFLLQLAANSAAKPTSSSWTISSDARLKKNIRPIDDSLERLLQLRGVWYQWIDPASQGGMDGTYTGMIAQEVEPVFPEWISEDKDGYKHLTVIGFEGLVVEALRDLRDEKDAEIAAIQAEKDAEIAALRARLDALETMVLSSQSMNLNKPQER